MLILTVLEAVKVDFMCSNERSLCVQMATTGHFYTTFYIYDVQFAVYSLPASKVRLAQDLECEEGISA